MRYSGLGLVLLGIAVLAHGAEPENSVFFLDPNLPAIQIIQIIPDGRIRTTPYRLILSIVPIQSADTSYFVPGFGSPSRSPAVIEKHKEIAWTASARCTEVFGSCRTSLLPLLRFESKGERIEIRPRRHALSIEWKKAFY